MDKELSINKKIRFQKSLPTVPLNVSKDIFAKPCLAVNLIIFVKNLHLPAVLKYGSITSVKGKVSPDFIDQLKLAYFDIYLCIYLSYWAYSYPTS